MNDPLRAANAPSTVSALKAGISRTTQNPPERPEIDHRTMKLIVGVIAISLPLLTEWLTVYAGDAPLTSISAAYYEQGWPQEIFIGFLFAIAAFLLAYNGLCWTEMALGKLGAIAALVVASFPCECGEHNEIIPGIHLIAAAIMFGVLAGFCYIFLRRARDKRQIRATARAVIYAICGVALLGAIVVLGLYHVMGDPFRNDYPRLVFFGEAIGLIAFGVSWLTASRTLPILTRRDERFSVFRRNNPA